MKILMIVAQYPPHAGGLEKQAKLLSETLCKKRKCDSFNRKPRR